MFSLRARSQQVNARLAASTRLGADGLAREVDASASTASGLGFVALLDLGGHGHEGLLDVGGALGGGLDERNAQGVGEFLPEKEQKEKRRRVSERVSELQMKLVCTTNLVTG